MTRSRARVTEASEDKQQDLSIGVEKDKINIDDSTNIRGIYELYGVYNTEHWDSLFHFVLYLKIIDGTIIKISHVEQGKNLIKIITEDMYKEDIADKTCLDRGNFKCKKSDIYKRALSLWANSDNIYKASTIFPSSCSGFVLSVLIFISDEFCIKLIKFLEKNGLNQDSLGVAIWKIGETNGLYEIFQKEDDIKTYEKKIKKLRMFDFKYEDYDKDSWEEIVYYYNLKKNNNQKDYSLHKSLKKRIMSKTGKEPPTSKKLQIIKKSINKKKIRRSPSIKLDFNPKNKSKNKKSLKKKSKKLRKSKN